MGASRAIYLDAAKVISVCLVVYWHTVFSEAAINQILMPLRMPLFFLVSGFFAGRAMQLDWSRFLSDKVLRLIYLYVLWSLILFFALEAPVAMMKGDEPDLTQPLRIFIETPRTIWFLYALAIAYLVGFVTFGIRRDIVIAVAFAIYFVPDLLIPGATDGDLITRICKLTPFFLLSLRYGDELRTFVETRNAPVIAAAVLYVPAVLLALNAPPVLGPPLILLVSGLGIVGLLGLLYRAESTRIVRAIAPLGMLTIFVFLLHRFPITVANFLAQQTGFTIEAWSGLVIASISVAVSALLGYWIIRPWFPWLERPFWLRPRSNQPRSAA